MKKLLIAVAVALSVVAIPAKAELVSAYVAGHAVVFGAGALFAKLTNLETHWSFRDGCKAQTVKAPGGGYQYESYEHCKALPRVYNGKPA